MQKEKIGFGGGCHWCTEGVFSVLNGVLKVDQGWIASTYPNDWLSEAIIVTFDPEIISLKELFQIHLLTHSSTSNHSMRKKYRSAIYTFNELQTESSMEILEMISEEEKTKFVTKVLPFSHFKKSEESFQNYFLKQPEKAFCKTYIHPKIKAIQARHKKVVNQKLISSIL